MTVKRKSLHLCMDYRQLDELVESVGEACFITSIKDLHVHLRKVFVLQSHWLSFNLSGTSLALYIIITIPQ